MFMLATFLCLAAAIDVKVESAHVESVSGMRESEGAAWDMHGAAAAGICSTGGDHTSFYIRNDGAVHNNNQLSACEQACTDDLACDYYCFLENAVHPDTGVAGANCLLYGGTCTTQHTSNGRTHTCYKKPASFYADINGHALPADTASLNHLDISLTDRSTCIRDVLVANPMIVGGAPSGNTGRVTLTMGRDCGSAMRAAPRSNNVNATDDVEECTRYFEYKFRGDHRRSDAPDVDQPASDTLVAEVQLCEYNSITHKCEAGHVHKVCPEGGNVVEVDEQ